MALRYVRGNVASTTNKSNTNIQKDVLVLLQLETHNKAIFDVAWNPIEFGQLVTASGDQTVKLWDIAGERPRHVRDFKDFSQSVKCVEFVPHNGHLMATGSRDGSILLWDATSGEDVGADGVATTTHVPL